MANLPTLALIVLLATGCGLVDQIMNPAQGMAPNGTATQNQNATPGNGTVVLQNLPANTTADELWALITKARVESICLSRAMDYAETQGYSRSVVFGCQCQAQETDDTKSYDCFISALDGGHPFTLDCTKAAASCSLTAEGKTTDYGLGQLQAEMAGG